jgi:hypothetical protein
MRHAVIATLAAGLLVSNLLAGAANADQCARPVDKTAFDVAGLKSQLMVTAIACQAEEKYNAFVARFRTDLQSHERALNGYFSRAYGRNAERQHDDYITSLANAQSETGIKAGTLFCQQNLAMFDEVLALKDGTALPTYAAGKSLTQPIMLTNCSVTAAKPTRTAKR